MSLISDPDWLIHHIRMEFLRSEDGSIGERIITFKQSVLLEPDQDQQQFIYLYDDVPGREMCYSPKIPNVSSDWKRISSEVPSRNESRAHSNPSEPASRPSTGKVTRLAQNDGKDTPTVDDSSHNSQRINVNGKDGHSMKCDNLTFQRLSKKNMIELTGKKSILAAKIQSQSTEDNPFAKDFSFVCGKGEEKPISLRIYFPHSIQPAKPITAEVKRDATVEEVIGYALYVYIEDKRKPDIRKNTDLCKCLSWNLRIVEDDGSIDEDFPALERKRKISKFSFDQFAVCVGLPAKITSQQKPPLAETSNGNLQESPRRKTGGNIFVKVHLYSTLEVKQTTTISLPGDMLISEVLVVCCKKRKIDPNDYTLKLADTKTDIPFDKTLESLGINELCLLKKDRGPSAGDIFLRPPEEIEKEAEFDIPAQISDEYSSVYKKYNVTRKLPMIMGKQERILAIDGDYVYIMPSENKNIFDSVKTVSFHASAIKSCKLVKKTNSSFKLTCQIKERDVKIFEFEASTPQEAGEICSRIHFMSNSSK